MSQKDKLLASAQKNLQKGLIDKAVRDYQQVVALDEKDMRHRQRLAELLVRAGKREEAVREFSVIGAFYADNMFFLKAIAVFKQIQKLDPNDVSLYVTLGTLNERQGLKGNAIAEYRAAAESYQKSGNLAEAAAVLEKMAGVDPENLAILVKKADLLAAASLPDKAYPEYLRAALVAWQKKDTGTCDMIGRRAGELKGGEKREFTIDFVQQIITAGQVQEGIAELERLLAGEPTNLRGWQMLAAAYGDTGDTANRRRVIRRMISLFPDKIEVWGTLIDCLAAENSIDEGLAAISSCRRDFGTIPPASLERFYKTLQEQAPEDVRILEGLRDLYTQTGNRPKLDDVMTRIRLLASAGAPPPPPVEAAPVDYAEEHGHWEEEIHLDDFLRDIAAEAGAGGVSVNPVDPPVAATVATNELEDQGDVAFQELLADLDVDISGVSLEEAEPLEAPGELPSPWGEIETAAVTGASAGEEGAAPDELSHFDIADSPASFEEPLIAPWVEEPLAEEPVVEDGSIEELPVEEFRPEEPVMEARPEEDLLDLVEALEEIEHDFDREETETHFNLGIAYREMGLYAEAVAEFRKSALDPGRRAAAATLEGMCHRDSGALSEAQRVLREALALPGLAAEERANISYELGLVLEQAGDTEEAIRWYQDAEADFPGFRDARTRALRLRDGGIPEEEVEDLDLEELELEDIE